MPKPLTGIKVLDFSKVLAGPLCTQYLGDLGAEVIKVEPILGGDETRGWPPFVGDFGAVFLSANRNKKSIAIDLRSSDGQRVIHDITKQCDVAVESFGTGVVERLQIDSATLRKINNRLIYCSISGFGRSGPMKDAPGYDVILQAFSGMMALSGEAGGSYMRSPISPIDQMTGMHALTGILAALYSRQTTGEGATISVSLLDTAIGLLGYNLQSFAARGVEPARCGSSHESLCPYQVFEAADGPVLIGVANDNLWRKFCKAMDMIDRMDDDRFRTNAARVANRELTVQLVSEAVVKRPSSIIVKLLSEAGVPCSPINSLSQMLAEPQVKSRGMVLRYDHPKAGSVMGIAQPVLFDGKEREPGLAVPALGEHSDAILTSFGFASDEVAKLRSQGVIA